MRDINSISRIYFIGIGGIGMSCLALYFKERGISVSGYDKTESKITQNLTGKGINIHYEDNIEKIDKKADVVVYTPAIPIDHKELVYYNQHNYYVLKRSDILSEITSESYNICVAGTHGKTTISTLIAHILRESGYGCTAFLGGISVNYDTNFWSDSNNVCVIEADEYDRSFLKLSPDIAVISSMDADHLDIYGTVENLENAFVDFSKRIKQDGILISKYGVSRSLELGAAMHIAYHQNDKKADAYSTNVTIQNNCYFYDVVINEWKLEKVVLNMGGLHNVENSIAAIAAAHMLGIDSNKIRKAIASFKGVKRRFEYILPHVASHNAIYIDDYAHHPEELLALISSAKALFPERRVVVIFQPHLYSRTRDLAQDFAESLDDADEVILLPIYPARELPIEGVSSNIILDKMSNSNKQVLERLELLTYLERITGKERSDLLFITAGAGDIDQLVPSIKKILINSSSDE